MITYAEAIFADEIMCLAAKVGACWEERLDRSSQEIDYFYRRVGGSCQLVEEYPDQVCKFNVETGLCPFMTIASRSQNRHGDDKEEGDKRRRLLSNVMKRYPELARFHGCCLETNQYAVANKLKMDCAQ